MLLQSFINYSECIFFLLVLLKKSLSKLATMCCAFLERPYSMNKKKRKIAPMALTYFKRKERKKSSLLKTKQCATDIILDSSSYFLVSIVLKTRCHGLHHMRIKFLHPAKQVKEVYFPVMSSDQLAQRGTKTTRLA